MLILVDFGKLVEIRTFQNHHMYVCIYGDVYKGTCIQKYTGPAVRWQPDYTTCYNFTLLHFYYPLCKTRDITVALRIAEWPFISALSSNYKLIAKNNKTGHNISDICTQLSWSALLMLWLHYKFQIKWSLTILSEV